MKHHHFPVRYLSRHQRVPRGKDSLLQADGPQFITRLRAEVCHRRPEHDDDPMARRRSDGTERRPYIEGPMVIQFGAKVSFTFF